MSMAPYKVAEVIESLTDSAGTKKALVITKAAKYLRGSIIEHNVRVSSDGRVRGRIVMKIDGNNKEVDSGDIASVEEQK